jgi:hypothetical protein
MQRVPGLRTERIELAISPNATRLRSVDAALLVQTGEERVISFPANEVRVGAVKSEGGVTVKIDGVEATEKGWHVAVTYERPRNDAPAQNPGSAGRIQQLMLANRSISVTLHDNDGQVHKPRMSTGGGGSGAVGGSIGFSSSNSNGTRRFSYGSEERNDGPTRSSHRYTFARIVGAQPEALEFRVMEHTGASQRIPIRLENLDLPAARGGDLLR